MNLILNHATLVRVVLDLLLVSFILILAKVSDLLFKKNERDKTIHFNDSNDKKNVKWRSEKRSA
jgi:hypothetical protein